MPAFGPTITSVRHQVFADLLQLAAGGQRISIRVLRGSPEGKLSGTRGDVAIDTDAAALWIKASASTRLQTSTGWVLVGSVGPQGAVEFGSTGWVTPFLEPAIEQIGSGAGLVNVNGPGTQAPSEGFLPVDANLLIYAGTGGPFVVTSEINIENPNGEETAFGMQLTLNGEPLTETQRTIILAANAIGAVSTSLLLQLSPGDVIGAQVGSLAGGADLSSTYFRLQASRPRVGSSTPPPPSTSVTFTFPGSDLLPLDLFHSRRALLGGELARCWVAWTDTQTQPSTLRVLDFGHGGSSADPTAFVPMLADATRTFVDLGNVSRSPEEVAQLVVDALTLDGVEAVRTDASVRISNAADGVVPPDVDTTDTSLRGMWGGQRDNWGDGASGQTLNQDGATGGIGSIHLPPLGSAGRVIGQYLWTIPGAPMDARLAFSSGPAYSADPGIMDVQAQGRMTAQGFGAIAFGAVGVEAADELWAQYRGDNGGGPRFRAVGATPAGLGDLVAGELLLWDTTTDPDAAVPFGATYTPVVDATFAIYIMIGVIFEIPDADGNYPANGMITLRIGDHNDDPDHGTQVDADSVQLSGENTHQRFQWMNWTSLDLISISRTVVAIAADEDSRPSMYRWADLNIPSLVPASLVLDAGPMGLTPAGAGASQTYTLPAPVPVGVEVVGDDAVISLGFNYVTDDGSPLAGYVLPVFIESLGDGAWLNCWEDDRATWHDNIPGASNRAYVSGVQEYRQRNVAGSPFESIDQTWPDPMITNAGDDSPPAIALDWIILRRSGISMG